MTDSHQEYKMIDDDELAAADEAARLTQERNRRWQDTSASEQAMNKLEILTNER